MYSQHYSQAFGKMLVRSMQKGLYGDVYWNVTYAMEYHCLLQGNGHEHQKLFYCAHNDQNVYSLREHACRDDCSIIGGEPTGLIRTMFHAGMVVMDIGCGYSFVSDM